VRSALAERPAARAGRLERTTLLIAGVVAALLLALAARASPDPRGLGTHESLGLPPCALYAATGIPCPSCGMTTAFAHAVRGHFAAAVRAQPLGFLVAIGAALAAPLAPALALLGTPVAARVGTERIRRLVMAFLAAAVLAWIYKILATFHLAGL
jgi:hypothetical protein